MKKRYFSPVTTIHTVQLQQMIAVSGVGSTADFTEDLTEETTDKALSRRRRTVWDDDE